MIPACTFTPITFKTDGYKYECCEYKNKFGEYSCEKECEKNCDESCTTICTDINKIMSKEIKELEDFQKLIESNDSLEKMLTYV